MLDILFVALFQAVAGDPAAAAPPAQPTTEEVAPAPVPEAQAPAAPVTEEAAPAPTTEEAATAPAAEETQEAEEEAAPRRRCQAQAMRASGTRLAVGPRCPREDRAPAQQRNDD
jgi:hypothetical protein